MDKALEHQLTELVRADQWLMGVLRAVRACNPPEWVIGAGLLRNLVWDHLHGYAERTPDRDVDLAYFDASTSDLRPCARPLNEIGRVERTAHILLTIVTRNPGESPFQSDTAPPA